MDALKVEGVADPLRVLEQTYLSDTKMLAHELGCSVPEAAQAQIEAAEAALPYLAGEEYARARGAISRAAALSKDTGAHGPRHEYAGAAPEAE